MRITVLSGGVGGARFTRGLLALLHDRLPDGAGGTTAQVTPCIANNLGKEFQDGVPVIEHGNTPGSREITINAARGATVGFVTVEPIPSGGSSVTYYDGQLYWPNRVTSGVFPDFARDNWHRAERAILLCNRDTTT